MHLSLESWRVLLLGSGPDFCSCLQATGTKFAVKVALDLTTEVMVMKRLTNHSNTVSLHAVFHEKERMYVVMTLCSGRTLRRALSVSGCPGSPVVRNI